MSYKMLNGSAPDHSTKLNTAEPRSLHGQNGALYCSKERLKYPRISNSTTSLAGAATVQGHVSEQYQQSSSSLAPVEEQDQQQLALALIHCGPKDWTPAALATDRNFSLNTQQWLRIAMQIFRLASKATAYASAS
nr:hypothetical protein CFP56_33753 [Quercus suber]